MESLQSSVQQLYFQYSHNNSLSTEPCLSRENYKRIIKCEWVLQKRIPFVYSTLFTPTQLVHPIPSSFIPAIQLLHTSLFICFGFIFILLLLMYRCYFGRKTSYFVIWIIHTWASSFQSHSSLFIDTRYLTPYWVTYGWSCPNYFPISIFNCWFRILIIFTFTTSKLVFNRNESSFSYQTYQLLWFLYGFRSSESLYIKFNCCISISYWFYLIAGVSLFEWIELVWPNDNAEGMRFVECYNIVVRWVSDREEWI